jgi:glutamate synthase domain-containing protein 2
MTKKVESRFRNPLSWWEVKRNIEKCIDCGTCMTICKTGAHVRIEGFNRMEKPLSHLCLGPACFQKEGVSCIDNCPYNALSVDRNMMLDALGDARWTPELILSTWDSATTGSPPPDKLEFQIGKSEGGFDKMRFVFPKLKKKPDIDDVDLSIDINRRDFGPKMSIPFPIYGGGMSYGSISKFVMIARAMAATELSTFISTGEGGYPDELIPYKDHVITQIATGLFGVREETIKRAPIVEFKYAQGAKPGLGGHLLSDKNTPEVSKMREAVPWTSLFSPFPFHSVYSIEDHKKHLDWVKEINPDAIISVKVSTPSDVDMVAVGSYYAGAHIIHLDGGYGGTGAAPEIAKKNIAMPIEYAIIKTHRFLEKEGIRDAMVMMVSGGVRTPDDVLKCIAMGADGVIIGTAELVALECVRCGNCERDRGCPIGIATSDPELQTLLDPEWGKKRIVNMYKAWIKRMKTILASMGLKKVTELRGRTDCLEHLDYL